MKHKNCPSTETKVIDSRPSSGNTRRRRKCDKCGEKFSTREITQADFDLHSELLDRTWAVLTSDGVAITNVTYKEAAAERDHIYTKTKDRGLVVTTAEAVARLTPEIAKEASAGSIRSDESQHRQRVKKAHTAGTKWERSSTLPLD